VHRVPSSVLCAATAVPKCPRTPDWLTTCAQVHALSIMAKTPAQWVQGGEKSQTTPSCLGGHGH
jgi:hypothetical protein